MTHAFDAIITFGLFSLLLRLIQLRKSCQSVELTFVHLAPPIQVAGVFEGDEIVLVNGEPAASAGPQGDKLQTSADLVTSFPKNGSGTGI